MVNREFIPAFDDIIRRLVNPSALYVVLRRTPTLVAEGL